MVLSGGRGTTGSGPSGRVTPAGRQGGSRGRWDLAEGDAESVLAEARRAFFVMAGFVAVIWVLQIANWADHYRITLEYGIRPRDIASLPDVLSAPFLHFSWAHIGGLAGGVAAGWIFRERRPKAPEKPPPATSAAGLNFTGARPGMARKPGGSGSPAP